MIQTRWRGYWTRQHHPEAVSVRKEMRAKRAEDHIVILRSELDKYVRLLIRELITEVSASCQHKFYI